MTGLPSKAFRIDPRAAVFRDQQRLSRRESGRGTFWRSLGVIGMVGWPIALGAIGGTLIGRWMDSRFDTHLRFTLMLMTAGVLSGSWAAWKTVTQHHA